MKTTILTTSALMLAAAASAAPDAPSQLPVTQPAAIVDCSNQDIKVYFEDGSTDVTPQAQAVIDTKLREVSVCRIGGVIVEAHTGSDGDEISNVDLSIARAVSVVNALRFNETQKPDIRIVPVGEQYAAFDTGSEKIMNRKAIIHLIMVKDPIFSIASIDH